MRDSFDESMLSQTGQKDNKDRQMCSSLESSILDVIGEPFSYMGDVIGAHCSLHC